MPRPVPAVERAMECQIGIRELRRQTHPLWEAAVATRDWTLIAEVKALAATLKVAALQARRIARIADVACPDGVRGIGHGRAA